MRSVKIITFHAVPNYGGVLQAYALSKTISELGFDVEIIDFRPSGRNGADLDGEDGIAFMGFVEKCLPLTPKVFASRDELDHLRADVFLSGSDQIWNFDKRKVHENASTYFLDFGQDSAKRVSYAASTGGTKIPREQLETVRKALSRFDHISVREPGSIENIRDATDKPVKVDLDPTFLINISLYSLSKKVHYSLRL